MLSPSFAGRVLLPQDYELIELLGCSEEEYRAFLVEAERQSRLSLSKEHPQNVILEAFLIGLVLGFVTTALQLLLAPKPPKPRNPPAFGTKQVDGQDIVRGDTFAAKSGFDSVQNVVEMGSIVPMVYANREIIDGVAYGGIRVNTDLLWSQMLSIGGNQFFRGIFLVGQGGMGKLDHKQYAIGDNMLNAYGLDGDGRETGRLSIYYRKNGGRIQETDWKAGRKPKEDEGNFARRDPTSTEVYRVPNHLGEYKQWSSMCFKPSTQTTFGLYAPIGCALSYRTNPEFSPMALPTTVSLFEGKDFIIKCARDPQVQTQRWRDMTTFSNRVEWKGRGDGAVQLSKGDEITLRLDNGHDGDRSFVAVETSKEPGKDSEGETSLQSAAQTIAGRQSTYDDSLTVGERYLIGTAVGICISRSNKKFVSGVEVKAGQAGGGHVPHHQQRRGRQPAGLRRGGWQQPTPHNTTHGIQRSATVQAGGGKHHVRAKGQGDRDRDSQQPWHPDQRALQLR